VSTTISPRAVEVAQKRIEALRVKGLLAELQFIACPMESVAGSVKEHCPFDAVFVFEALHHAFDWRAAITSSFACLRPGGWLMICDEPNVLHTAISYRVARLSNTHEIGFSKSELVRHLKNTGFGNIVSLGKRPHLFFQAHWLAAQKL
jgi:SAM-dependent methyltransferase